MYTQISFQERQIVKACIKAVMQSNTSLHMSKLLYIIVFDVILLLLEYHDMVGKNVYGDSLDEGG